MIEELKAYIDSGGKISQTTLMSLFSFFQDPELEVKKIEEDEKESIKKAQKVFIKTLETSMMTNKMMIQKILLIKGMIVIA